jgi:glucokinase
MPALGLDIGGTKTAALVAERGGPALGEAGVATDTTSPAHVVAGAVAATRLALDQACLTLHDLTGAGAGVPGQVDPTTGTVQLAVNLGIHTPYPLAQALQDALGVPVVVENDVRAAALGAYQWLNATTEPACNSLAYLSIGTGIAAGIVLDGRLYRGTHGMAGEIGHIPVDPVGPRCACGAYGCLEAIASGPAIAAYAAEVLAPAGETLTTLDVYALAAAGDQSARHVVGRAGHFLSRAIYLLVMTYDVDKIVLGGGVTRAGDSFRQPLEKALDDLRADSALANAMLPDDKVLTLPVGLNAGAYGALLLMQDTAAAAVE